MYRVAVSAVRCAAPLVSEPGRTSTTSAGRRFTRRPCSTIWLDSRLRGSDVLSCVSERLLGLRLPNCPTSERAPLLRSPTAHPARRHSREGGNPDLPDSSLCRGAVRAGWHGLGRTSTTSASHRFTRRPCSTMWLVSRLRGSDVLSCLRERLLGLRLCSGPATERAPQPRSPTAHCARRHSREGGNPDLPNGSLCRGVVRAGWHRLGRTSTTSASRRFTSRPCSTIWLDSRLRGSDVLCCGPERVLG